VGASAIFVSHKDAERYLYLYLGAHVCGYSTLQWALKVHMPPLFYTSVWLSTSIGFHWVPQYKKRILSRKNIVNSIVFL